MHSQCLKSVRILSFSSPYFPTVRLNTEIYGVSVRIQSKWGKIWTRKTPNKDTFYAVSVTLPVRIMNKNNNLYYNFIKLSLIT